MPQSLLQRSDAPFGVSVWEAIDLTVREAAAREVSVRRFLELDGPLGLGMRAAPAPGSVPLGDDGETSPVAIPRMVPLPLITSRFRLSARDVDGYERLGLPMDLDGAARAAVECARWEDRLLLYGSAPGGIPGLLTASGTHSSQLREWKQAGDAFEDLAAAMDVLDTAGFHGPYALALAPPRFNLLFRRYPHGDLTEIEHLRQMATDGVVKSPAIERDAGLLIAAGRQYASIILGQDLLTAFEGPQGREYVCVVSESLALRLAEPGAVCRLQT
jgi:uncharacterized linocin/CFP29 family protein